MNATDKQRFWGVILLCALFLTPAPAVRAEEMDLSAKAGVLMDPVSGKVLWEQNPHQQLEPASITKIMTQVLILEALQAGQIKLDDPVIASEAAYRMGGSQIDLFPGEEMTVKELLMAISLHSANDACIAMAEHLAGTTAAFVAQMNAKAKAIGMQDTTFQNPHGLSAPGHVTSAYDVALLSSYALRETNIIDYSSVWEYWLRDGKRWLVNRNSLVHPRVGYTGADGLKTGYTAQAQNCVSATAVRNDLRLVAVIMGAPTSVLRFGDARALLDYGFTKYRSEPVLKKGDLVKTVLVAKGSIDQLQLTAAADFSLTAPKGEEANITQEVVLTGEVVAPIRKGEKIGEVIIKSAGVEAGRVDLLAGASVERGSVFRTIYRFFRRVVSPVRNIFVPQ